MSGHRPDNGCIKPDTGCITAVWISKTPLALKLSETECLWCKVHRKWLLVQRWEGEIPQSAWLRWCSLKQLLHRKCIIGQNTHESPLAQSSRGVLKRGSGKQISLPTGFKFSQIHKLISLPLPFFLSCVCVWLPKPTCLLASTRSEAEELHWQCLLHSLTCQRHTLLPLSCTSRILNEGLGGYLQPGSCWAGGVSLK